MGLSESHISRLLRRASIWRDDPDGVGDGLRIALSRSRWADHGPTLDALAGLAPMDRRRVVTMLTRDDGPAPSLAAALLECGLRDEPARREEALNRLLTAWRKATAKADRRAFLERILADATTRKLFDELREQAEDADTDSQTRVLRAVGKRARA